MNMGDRLTTNQFIEKSKNLYDFLDYGKTNYTNRYSHVKLKCLLHEHEYTQRPCDHYKARGCSLCLKESVTMRFDEWYERCLIINKFDHDLSKTFEGFVDINSVVTVVCRHHGEYEAKAKQFMRGKANCKKCVKKYSKNREEIISDFILKHGEKFDYSLVSEDCKMGDKIKIICKKHGVFHQKAYAHMVSTFGCKMCCDETKGWSRTSWVSQASNKTCIFYVIKCYNEHEVFFKIGITSQSLEDRYKNKRMMPYSYEVIKKVEGCAEHIWDLEKSAIRSLLKFRYVPLIKFKGGKVECFYSIEDLSYEL